MVKLNCSERRLFESLILGVFIIHYHTRGFEPPQLQTTNTNEPPPVKTSSASLLPSAGGLNQLIFFQKYGARRHGLPAVNATKIHVDDASSEGLGILQEGHHIPGPAGSFSEGFSCLVT